MAQGDLYNRLLEQQIDNHAETMRALGSLESKLESVHGETKKTNGRVTELERRVQELYEARSYAHGSVATVGTISAVLGSGLTLFLKWFIGSKG